MLGKQLLAVICVFAVGVTSLVAQEEGKTAELATVQIDVLFVEFSTEDIERMSRNHAQPLPLTGGVVELWRSGAGTLLHAVKLTTRSGVAASVEAVREIIYPTEFESSTSTGTNAAESASYLTPVPSTFETRQVGAIVHCTPTVAPNGQTVDLAVAIELCDEPGRSLITVTGVTENGQKLELSVPQPIFFSRNITTSIVVNDQTTHVFGGMKNSAGDGILYLLLTPTLMDAAGRPIME